jgi:catechol 2,3-dioxygenase-like lactoylglutathione lyase family enzyme
LDHFLVLTDDIDGTRDFYAAALGLEPGQRPDLGFPGHWLYLDGVPCVHVADREAYSAFVLAGLSEPLDHVAFTAGGYEEVAARLAASGIEAETNEAPGLRQLFFRDPNGLKIEINVMEEAT